MLLLALLLPLLWAGESGEHWGSPLGAGMELSLCVPSGSLQEESSYWLLVQESVNVLDTLCILGLASSPTARTAGSPPPPLTATGTGRGTLTESTTKPMNLWPRMTPARKVQ